MKLRFTPRALDDLANIADFIGAHDPAAAKRVRAAIYGTLRLLISFPQLGRMQAVENVHKIVTRRYGYIVYYLIDERADAVVILNVKHPAQAREYSDN
jgi:plasmid stabilization system protein ParE